MELAMVIKILNHHKLQEGTLYYTKRLLLKDDSPLIDLGCIAMAQSLHIVATGKTAILCHLLQKLLRECCVFSAKIYFVKDYSGLTCSFIKSKVLTGGCIGVVTAQSDVDSAVANFLSAPQGDIWGIRRILVQESAIDRFKKAMAWKSKSRLDIDTELKSQCSDLYHYDGKIYLYEYVGTQSDINVVIIEAFRTVKELISFIEFYSPFCVSLWSSGVAECNEIALGVSAPLVWVNDYGLLGGPAEFYQVYYSQISISSAAQNAELELAYLEVCELQKAWEKLTILERKNKTLRLLETSTLNYQKKLLISRVEAGPKSNYFAYVAKNGLVIGINKLHNVYTVRWHLNLDIVSDLVERLIAGSGFLIRPNPQSAPASDEHKDFMSIITILSNSDLPIRVKDFETTGELDTYPLAQKTKLVYTTFGTVFAN
ncbi:uncharacterized protein [Epargyreus clarus]